MRLKVFLALVALPAYAAETSQTKSVPIDHLTAPVAEPADGGFYAPPVRSVDNAPTPEDIGPVQKHFALASTLDTDVNAANPRTANNEPVQPMALDQHIRVPLVHDVQDDSSFRIHGSDTLNGDADDSLLFEIQYLNWGAVTREQLLARRGHYFTITVVNGGTPSDLTMHFEYRQVKSKQVVRSLVQEKKHVRGAVRAYFGVVNHAYIAYGPVSAWRFTVLRGNTIVAEAKSFLW
jgi:hypothetical protein